MIEKSLTVLGCTGSIGRNTLDVAGRFPGAYTIHALAARSNVDSLMGQIERFRPAVAVLYEEEAAASLRKRLPASCRTSVLSGLDGLLEAAAAPEADHVVAGMVGAVGLRPAFAAIEAGKEISIANKETMVLAGQLMMERARETGSILLPMDSEHNAVFQCLAGNNIAGNNTAGNNAAGGNSKGDETEVERIILTASGGPFRDLPPEKFKEITRKQALAHPNWNMGPKITIDSATMMNKGLEVIEARWLFGLPPERIAVVVHRQSIVHSLVEFVDGSLIAQLGLPDMRTPIAYCLAYPQRLPLDLPRLNLAEVGKLEFEEVSPQRFPVFFLALEALALGGGMPAALNGANEETVAAYLDGAFPFTEIAVILKESMARMQRESGNGGAPPCIAGMHTVEDAISADRYGREVAIKLIQESSEKA